MSAGPAVPKKSKPAKPNHPPYSEMITEAIKKRNDRGGTSKQAIDKYISETYKIAKTTPHLKLALKKLVGKETLKQVKGTGASGSFKLGEQPKAPKPKKVVKPKAKTVKPAKKKSSAVASKGRKVKPAKKIASAPKKKPAKSPGKKASGKKSPKKSIKAAAKSKKPAAKKGVKKPTPKKPAKKAAKAK